MEQPQPSSNAVPSIQNISQGISNVTTTVQNSLGEFSSKNIIDAGNDFLNANGILAKFAFIFLILLVFVFLFKTGITLISYFTQPPSDPYLFTGSLDGSSSLTITQNPANKSSITIQRSNNQSTGVEYTYSTWLMFKEQPNVDKDSKYYPIFIKGDIANLSSSTDGANNINGPGLYMQNVAYNKVYTSDMESKKGSINLIAVTDLITSDTTNSGVGQTNFNSVIVNNIPIMKWVHVALRVENTMMDIYVNGVLAGRLQMAYYPKQNYNDLYVHPNGGFNGSQSNLRYYSRALNVFEINNIVMFGPNTNPSSFSPNTSTGNYSYLSHKWYTT